LEDHNKLLVFDFLVYFLLIFKIIQLQFEVLLLKSSLSNRNSAFIQPIMKLRINFIPKKMFFFLI